MLGPLQFYRDLRGALALVTAVAKISDISSIIILAHRFGGCSLWLFALVSLGRSSEP